MPRSPLSMQFRPTEGFYTTQLVKPSPLPVGTFLPAGYEPYYPYPLVIFFHRDGGNEDQVLRLAPRVSRRNYISISLRAPQLLGIREDGRMAYGWGENGENDELIQEYLLRAVETTRKSYHIHSERVYLAGVEEGATQAYRMALRMPDKIAGVVSFNGFMPQAQEGQNLLANADIRGLKVLMGHGLLNENANLETARRDYRMLLSAGARVSFETYETNHKVHPHMLRDMNRWIISNVNSEIDTWIDDGE